MGLFEKSRWPGYAATILGAGLAAREAGAEQPFDVDVPEVLMVLGVLAAIFGPAIVRKFSSQEA